MSIDFIGSFDYAGFTENNRTFTNNSGVTDLSAGQKGVYTYRVGANFNFRIFEKVMFKTGIRFASLGDNFYMDDLRWPSQIGDNGFEAEPSLPTYINIITKHRYIEVPLIVRYEINNKKLSPFIEFGLAPHLYINTKSINKTNLGRDSQIINYSEFATGFNKLQLAAVVSFGANYNVSEMVQAFVQPTLRYHINRQTDNQSSTRFYSIGIEFGVRKMFGSYFNNEKV
tara:strand:+ start:138 stop:818 length:681 start_codon:yes stop_codon:yes gene_type:complete